MKYLFYYFNVLFLLVSCEAREYCSDLSEQRHLLSQHDINYTSCKDTMFYGDDDFYYYDEDECHRLKFPADKTLQDRLFEDVKVCCNFHGYLTMGKCYSKVKFKKQKNLYK